MNAVTNATSATGSDISVLAMVVKMSRRLPCRRSREVGAEQHRHQDGGADDRHREQHLKGRLGDELNRDRLPVRGRQQRAALEQVLQVQIDFTIAPVYPVLDLVPHPAHRARRRRGRARRWSGRVGARAVALRRVGRGGAAPCRDRTAAAVRRRARPRSARWPRASPPSPTRCAPRRAIRPPSSALVRLGLGRHAGRRRRHAPGSRSTTTPVNRSRGRAASPICRKERVLGPATLFIAPGALGPRLVRIEPVSRIRRARRHHRRRAGARHAAGRAGLERHLRPAHVARARDAARPARRRGHAPSARSPSSSARPTAGSCSRPRSLRRISPRRARAGAHMTEAAALTSSR